ncbi:helix-turn-helix transcriptional regulator [Moraxella nasicaprae]|uniref:AlpA family phage regulatory protein n=1 Tax=Moraxella nasicaprae TaxID=2904122 RepID=A0ABY6F623_9GAMM|nr:AlpA family phage regulatory protein [Moraxella nasicaprae]UXZ05542.1 AlpA family phage regulatory protein [Moraxella nasicaprae]
MSQNNPTTLPQDGMSRLNQLLPYLPIGKSTVWAWVKQGKFPPPIKFGTHCTAWKNSDILSWLDNPNGWQEPKSLQGGKNEQG